MRSFAFPDSTKYLTGLLCAEHMPEGSIAFLRCGSTFVSLGFSSPETAEEAGEATREYPGGVPAAVRGSADTVGEGEAQLCFFRADKLVTARGG